MLESQSTTVVLGFANFLARDKLGLAHLPLLLRLGSASYQSGDCGTARVHLCIILCRE